MLKSYIKQAEIWPWNFCSEMGSPCQNRIVFFTLRKVSFWLEAEPLGSCCSHHYTHVRWYKINKNCGLQGNKFNNYYSHNYITLLSRLLPSTNLFSYISGDKINRNPSLQRHKFNKFIIKVLATLEWWYKISPKIWSGLPKSYMQLFANFPKFQVSVCYSFYFQSNLQIIWEKLLQTPAPSLLCLCHLVYVKSQLWLYRNEFNNCF